LLDYEDETISLVPEDNDRHNRRDEDRD